MKQLDSLKEGITLKRPRIKFRFMSSFLSVELVDRHVKYEENNEEHNREFKEIRVYIHRIQNILITSRSRRATT